MWKGFFVPADALRTPWSNVLRMCERHGQIGGPTLIHNTRSPSDGASISINFLSCNPFPSRFINRTIFFCYVLESDECACCLLSFLYFHWLFPLSAREASSGNSSIYKSIRDRVDPKGLCGRWRLHLMRS